MQTAVSYLVSFLVLIAIIWLSFLVLPCDTTRQCTAVQYGKTNQEVQTKISISGFYYFKQDQSLTRLLRWLKRQHGKLS